MALLAPQKPYRKQEEAIESLANRITAEFGFTIHLCGEIECTFSAEPPQAMWDYLFDACEVNNLPLKDVARERGAGQFEFRLIPTGAKAAAAAVSDLKKLAADIAIQYALTIDFNALPNPTQPGNGLHWHLHLANHAGVNVFLKQDEQLSQPLADTLGGMLTTLPALMPCFAPTPTSYARLQSGQDHVPTTVSWGGNNRTVALRLPESVVAVRHIEHRVCGADADPAAAVWALLVGVHYGLSHHPDPGCQVFGNADDAHYALQRLPISVEEAQAEYDKAEWLKAYTPFA